MLVFAILALLLGATLGQRFRVVVLVPALALTAVGAAAFVEVKTGWHLIGAIFLATTSLQVGYLIGLAVRTVLATTRLNRTRGKAVGPLTPSRAVVKSEI